MKEQFVTYEIAKKLKELGFNEECFGYYTLSGNFFGFDFKKAEMLKSSQLHEDVCAPLWQQAIEFLYYPCGIDVGFHYELQIWTVSKHKQLLSQEGTQEDAILAALEFLKKN